MKSNLSIILKSKLWTYLWEYLKNAALFMRIRTAAALHGCRHRIPSPETKFQVPGPQLESLATRVAMPTRLAPSNNGRHALRPLLRWYNPGKGGGGAAHSAPVFVRAMVCVGGAAAASAASVGAGFATPWVDAARMCEKRTHICRMPARQINPRWPPDRQINGICHSAPWRRAVICRLEFVSRDCSFREG